MAVTATLQQTCTSLPDGGGRVVAAITASNGISDSLFVFTVEDDPADDKFHRVAFPYDITSYPIVRDAAIPYYRLTTATIDFADINTAIAAKLTLIGSVTQSLVEYDSAANSFVEVLNSNLSS